MDIEMIGRQNPWWTHRGAITTDPCIREFEASALKWNPDYLDSIELGKDSVFVVFGPRQVGKTTSFKLIIRKLLEERNVESRRVMFLNCEEVAPSTPQRLAEVIRSYATWVRAKNDERLFILLDEATYIRDWERGIKILAGEGRLQNVTLLATGSHLMGMRRGAERLPGRRGAGFDIPLWPLSFRQYLNVLAGDLKEKLPAFQGWSQKSLVASVEESSLQGEIIHSIFDSYLKTGGFPRSINQLNSSNYIKSDIYKLYRDGFLGDLIRIGRKETVFRELVQWILLRRENPFEWSDAARETYAGTHPTVREYMEDAESCFLWDILYKVKEIGKPFRMPRSPKKAYFRDPFIFHCMRAWGLGYPDPFNACEDFLKDPGNYGYLVEATVASHLKRFFGEQLFYYRNTREIDFVIFQNMEKAALLEVKYQARINAEDAKVLKGHGGGIILTKNSFRLQENILLIPAPYFLSLL